MQILTPVRLQSYLAATDQDSSSAIVLYKWNSQLAAEFLQLLGLVEIAVRNSIDRELQTLNVTLGNDTSWLDDLKELTPPIRRANLNTYSLEYDICIFFATELPTTSPSTIVISPMIIKSVLRY